MHSRVGSVFPAARPRPEDHEICPSGPYAAPSVLGVRGSHAQTADVIDARTDFFLNVYM